MWKVNLYLRMILKSHTEVLLYVKPPLKFSSKCMLSSFSWHWGHTAKCWLRLHRATNPCDPSVPSPHAPAEPTSHKCLAKLVFLLKESINTCQYLLLSMETFKPTSKFKILVQSWCSEVSHIVWWCLFAGTFTGAF